MDDDHPADIGRPRRQGDRITPLFVAAAYDRLWHEAAVRRVRNYVRFLGYSGREMLAVRLSHFDPRRTSCRLDLYRQIT